MSRQSAAPSFRSNFIPLADWTISHFTSDLPRRSRHLQSETPRTSVCPRSSPPPVEPLEFHRVNPATIPHINDNPDWVDAPIPVPTPAFQTPPVANHNPINNQLAEALWQLSENLNRGSAPKPHQSKARIPDTFNGSDPHKLNHFLFQCQLFPCQSFVIFHRCRENQFHDDLSLWCSARLVRSRTTTGRPRLCITLAFHLAPLCGRAPSAFWTLGPSRGYHQSYRQPLYEARR